VKIVSVEDPVEYLLPGVNQVSISVDPRVGLTYATVTRALMRQDPDVFMVGEALDRETAELCVKAALTGHLVLTQLHAPDATGAISRLRDMGVEPFRIAAAVKLVTAQRLVRRPCSECQETYPPPAEVLRALGLTPEDATKGFVRARGCDACGGTGYRRRIALYEVLTMTEELARMVAERTPEATLRALALEQGMLWPFRSDAAEKVAGGATTLEELERVLPGISGGG
jgi:type IV pilus assembly protein PilB